MAFEQELGNLFASLAKPAEPTQPVITQTAEPLKLEDHVTPAATPNVDSPVVPTASQTQGVFDPNALIDDWDQSTPSPAVPQVAPVQPDYSAIAKALDLEAANQEAIVAAIASLKVKNSGQPTGLPDDLSTAIKLAQDGGNYLEYLKVSSIDWSKQDPIMLYENWMYDRLGAQGRKAEEIDNYLDKIDEVEKEARGIELVGQYISHQRAEQSRIQNQAVIEKQQREVAARQALDSFNDVYGFKLSYGHKEELFKDLTTTAYGRALVAQTGGDFRQAARGLFLLKYGDTVDKIRRKQLEDVAKRDYISSVTNAKITSPGEPANPGTPKKEYGLQEYLEQLKQSQGLM